MALGRGANIYVNIIIIKQISTLLPTRCLFLRSRVVGKRAASVAMHPQTLGTGGWWWGGARHLDLKFDARGLGMRHLCRAVFESSRTIIFFTQAKTTRRH